MLLQSSSTFWNSSSRFSVAWCLSGLIIKAADEGATRVHHFGCKAECTNEGEELSLGQLERVNHSSNVCRSSWSMSGGNLASSLVESSSMSKKIRRVVGPSSLSSARGTPRSLHSWISVCRYLQGFIKKISQGEQSGSL